jgi:GNAT superfamily N-acetyltransferase
LSVSPAPGGDHADAFLVRPAAIADVPAIVDLVRALAAYERLAHLCVATENDIARGLFGERPFAEVLIAEKSGRIAGFALFFHNFSTFLGRPGLWLEDLFVLPEHRRQGCGKALLLALARVAAQRGCGRFEWAVLDWNESAIAFYESLGATLLADWRIVRVTGAALEAMASGTPPAA